MLQAAAILELHGRGYVEPVKPSREAFHIFAHQVMAVAVQVGGVVRSDIWPWLHGAAPFAAVTQDDQAAIIEHMLATKILADQDGRLWLGPEGERVYGRANFRELYAVFSSPRLVTVKVDVQEIGQVEAQFLAAMEGPTGAIGACFTLGGKAWLVQHIDWERGVCIVRPAPHGAAPRWNGGARWLSYDLCQAMRRVLISDDVAVTWSERAKNEVATQRHEHAFLHVSASPVVESAREITWYNYAGGAANLLLQKVLESELGEKVVARNVSLTFREDAGKSLSAVHQLFERLRAEGRPNHADALRFAEGAKRGRLSKFEACLPDGMLQRFFAATVVDVEGARKAVDAAPSGGPQPASAF